MKRLTLVLLALCAFAASAQADLVLRQAMASQAVLLGPAVDSTDGNASNTGYGFDPGCHEASHRLLYQNIDNTREWDGTDTADFDWPTTTEDREGQVGIRWPSTTDTDYVHYYQNFEIETDESLLHSY